MVRRPIFSRHARCASRVCLPEKWKTPRDEEQRQWAITRSEQTRQEPAPTKNVFHDEDGDPARDEEAVDHPTVDRSRSDSAPEAPVLRGLVELGLLASCRAPLASNEPRTGGRVVVVGRLATEGAASLEEREARLTDLVLLAGENRLASSERDTRGHVAGRYRGEASGGGEWKEGRHVKQQKQEHQYL